MKHITRKMNSRKKKPIAALMPTTTGNEKPSLAKPSIAKGWEAR